MSVSTTHPIEWVCPGPLWSSAAEAAAVSDPTTSIRQPALLAIADDSFMRVLQQQLASEPAGIANMLAVPVSYRVRPPGRPTDWEPDPASVPLKLYQAAHGHFNLIAASLVCQVPGLPDHGVHPELSEQVAFVLRRADDAGEWAWASQGGALSWQLISASARGAVASGEKLLPMFPVKYSLSDHPRTLFVGLVPTSSVETFNIASTTAPAGSTTPQPSAVSALLDMGFHTRVSEPLAQLIVNAASPPDPLARIAGSSALLLEFASFLNDSFPTSWQAVTRGGSVTAANQTLFAALATTVAGTTVATDTQGQPLAGPTYVSQIMWLDALTATWAQADWLSGESVPVPPNPLAVDLNHPSQPLQPPQPTPGIAQIPTICTTLEKLVHSASPEPPATGSSNVPGPVLATVPKFDPSHPTEYVIRCVYRRPECGPVGDTLSGPTESFQIAPFFDFDAPVRPVTISLPQVQKLSDLRKFQKNVNFLFTKELHAQMDRIIDLKSTMAGTLNQPQPGSADGLNVRWVCSFSISIVFIVALFLLLMFVIMLNLFFFWLPFFEVCLPVPE